MRKFSKIVLAMLAVFAFGAILASAAFAEETLPAEWLANGNKITESLTTESTGELLLEDAGNASAVLCKGGFNGTVNSAGKDTTTEILNAKGETTGLSVNRALLGTGTGSECTTVKNCAEGTATSPIEVYPIGLPWTTALILDATTEKFLDVVSSSGEVGYELSCLVLGIKVEDVCKRASTDIEIKNGTSGAEIPTGATAEPLSTCSISKSESGTNVADSPAVIKLVSKEALTASE